MSRKERVLQKYCDSQVKRAISTLMSSIKSYTLHSANTQMYQRELPSFNYFGETRETVVFAVLPDVAVRPSSPEGMAPLPTQSVGLLAQTDPGFS